MRRRTPGPAPRDRCLPSQLDRGPADHRHRRHHRGVGLPETRWTETQGGGEAVGGGATARPDSFVQVAGGKGLNVARAARALGADVVAVALLRGHAGRWLAEGLAAEGVRSEVVWTH